MRIGLLFFILVSLGLTGCGKKPEETKSPVTTPPAAAPATQPDDLLVRWHFAGGEQLAGDTNAGALHEVLALPIAAEYRARILERLSQLPFHVLRSQLEVATNDFAAAIRPLCDDLLAAESFGEVCGGSNATDLAFAIRLTDERAAVWSATLSNVLAHWIGAAPSPLAGGPAGSWEIKRANARDIVRLTKAGGWLVLGAGREKLSLVDELSARIKSGGRPASVAADNWLDMTVDSDWLSRSVGLPAACVAPSGKAELTVSGEGGFVRAKGRLLAAQPLRWRPETWTIPTNLIREPLISFTAAQGVAARLGQFSIFSELGVPPPNQCFFWALDKIPFQSYAAFPVADAAAVLTRSAPRMTSFYERHASLIIGQLQAHVTNHMVAWTGLPFVAPQVEAVKDETGEFFFLGAFPNSAGAATLPTELLERVQDRTNLVYYDWEITQGRLLEWRALCQLVNIVCGRDIATSNDLSQCWIEAIAPKLGNSVTEITVDAPQELSFTRKSAIGLTSLELLLLTEWLDSPDFPAWTILRPARTPRQRAVPTITR